MEINITTPALLFPAISLLLLAYTNRFISLAAVIRILKSRLGQTDNDGLLLQIENLRMRISLIRYMQAFGVMSMLSCVITMIVLFNGYEFAGRVIFVISLLLMILSLLVSLWEIMLSGNALQIELQGIRDSRNV
jgi:hypothetical protein